jgi:hypothetical protein
MRRLEFISRNIHGWDRNVYNSCEACGGTVPYATCAGQTRELCSALKAETCWTCWAGHSKVGCSLEETAVSATGST